MAQQLQILVALVEDPDSMASGSLPFLAPVPGALMLSSDSEGNRHVHGTYTCR